MRGKPVTSGERAIILNVFKHLRGNYPLESQGSIIERTSKATGSSISTIKRIIKEEDYDLLERKGPTGRNSLSLIALT